MELCSSEAMKYVWEGAIPLQIHLHESEVTTLPSPPPILVLGPRIGFLPLLVPLIKPHFNCTLPPGTDTVWFDYKGLPLKWYIPTGVLFDILCAEPERPWNLTVHFRGYPGELLTPCDGEDSVKWSFINSLKEAAYIINGNCKNVMNMSQADQFELWQSLMKANMESYLRVSSRLKLGPVGGDCLVIVTPSSTQSKQAVGETDSAGSNRLCRIPVRLYVRSVGVDIEDMEDVSAIDSWDKILYVNRPVEIHKEEGCSITLERAMKSLLPEIFEDELSLMEETDEIASNLVDSETTDTVKSPPIEETSATIQRETTPTKKAGLKLVRIQGIELDSQVPFAWVVNNLKHPDFFLHICVFITSPLTSKAR